MTCIAIDDEPLALDLLEDNIKRIPFLRFLGRCNHAFEATEFLLKEQVDLIFLDIQMPGISGLQLVSTLHHKPLVIFVTAYKHFAVEGFELDAVDYLVKPVSFERFAKASNKAYEMFQMRQKKDIAIEKVADHAFVYSEYSLVRINFDDITHVEGLKDYVKIHLLSQPRPLLTRQTLKGMEALLPNDRFVRIHKSFIINIQKVQSIRRNLLHIGAFEIPFSDSYKEELGHFLPEIRGL